MVDKLGEYSNTDRGFPLVKFKDHYEKECSLQASSLALYAQPGISAVWLGADRETPKIMAKDALKHGIKTTETTGWVDYPIPDEVLISSHMHLNREQVEGLIDRLQSWLDSDDGSFE